MLDTTQKTGHRSLGSLAEVLCDSLSLDVGLLQLFLPWLVSLNFVLALLCFFFLLFFVLALVVFLFVFLIFLFFLPVFCVDLRFRFFTLVIWFAENCLLFLEFCNLVLLLFLFNLISNLSSEGLTNSLRNWLLFLGFLWLSFDVILFLPRFCTETLSQVLSTFSLVLFLNLSLYLSSQ